MKLLFDENLARELVEALADSYPDSQHVHERGLGASDDRDVWDYARSSGFVIVTKDTDFYNRSLRVGAPPKVVWLRLGNCTTAAVEMLLRNSEQTLTRLLPAKRVVWCLDGGESQGWPVTGTPLNDRSVSPWCTSQI